VGWALCSRNNEREATEARTKEANTNTVPLSESRPAHSSAYVLYVMPLSESRPAHSSAYVLYVSIRGVVSAKQGLREPSEIVVALPKFEGGFWCSSSEKMSLRGSKE